MNKNLQHDINQLNLCLLSQQAVNRDQSSCSTVKTWLTHISTHHHCHHWNADNSFHVVFTPDLIHKSTKNIWKTLFKRESNTAFFLFLPKTNKSYKSENISRWSCLIFSLLSKLGRHTNTSRINY